ncbi:thiamine pyrophosphokinase [Clavulina sp. PMI_390]|nr:thiamine pyrophosphokinase [Clavulina sp. PMI_390]
MGGQQSAPREWTIPFLSSLEFRQRASVVNELERSPWALIVLNTQCTSSLLKLVWDFCQVRYCADGGCNRVYDALEEHERNLFLPDAIKGDLDSARPDVLSFYASKEVTIIQDKDEYSTDLMKCISLLSEKEEASGLKYNVLLLGGLGGRLDQSIHSLSYLLKQRTIRPNMMAVSEDSVAWVLDSGEHILHVDLSLLGPTCGLLPVGVSKTRLTTEGLEWNLTDHESSMEGLLSTSNHVIDDVVKISTTEPIVWTVAVKQLS